MTKGNVLNITKDGKRILLNEQTPNNWFDLAEWIKPNYLKRGECDYKLDQTNPKLITWIKCSGSGSTEQPNNYPPYVQESPVEVVDMNKPTQFVPESQVTELPPKENYWDNKAKKDVEIQESIQNQFCLREGLRAIEILNQTADPKIAINSVNISNYAKMIKASLEML